MCVHVVRLLFQYLIEELDRNRPIAASIRPLTRYVEIFRWIWPNMVRQVLGRRTKL
jgi:hypothetical protein